MEKEMIVSLARLEFNFSYGKVVSTISDFTQNNSYENFLNIYIKGVEFGQQYPFFSKNEFFEEGKVVVSQEDLPSHDEELSKKVYDLYLSFFVSGALWAQNISAEKLQ